MDYYIRSGKLSAVTHGAYRNPGPPLKWQNMVYSLSGLGCRVHVGRLSALAFYGFQHFLEFSQETEVGIEEVPFGTWDWPIRYAFAERAFLELTSTMSSVEDLYRSRLMMESASSLRPALIQSLLEQCMQVREEP